MGKKYSGTIILFPDIVYILYSDLIKQQIQYRIIIRKLTLYGTEGRLFTTDVSAKFKVT